MRIALAADHAGFLLKEHLRSWLGKQGHDVVDYGTRSEESTDYPDYAREAASAVSSGDAERAVLVCSTGAGMAIAANKIRGIRATLAANSETVRLTRAHNDANVLAVGALFTTPEQARDMVSLFLETDFEGGRHLRRINKIAQIEQG